MADGLDINLRPDEGTEGPDTRSGGKRLWDGFVEVLTSWGPAILLVLVIRSILVEPFQIPSGSMVPTLAIGDFILVSKFTYGLRIPFTNTEILPLGEPERGNIVVFIYPPTESKDPMCGPKHLLHWVSGGSIAGPEECSTDYIKRIVGLPGDTIEVRDSVVYINGKEESRVRDGSYPYVDQYCRAEDMQKWSEDLEGVTHPALQSSSFVGRMQDFGPATVPPDHYFMMGDNRDNSSDSRVWGFVPRENIRGKAMFVWLSIDSCAGGGAGMGSIRWDRLGQGLH